MGLVKCPDCGHEVSDLAPACPKCARPMRDADKPVTIEQTSKRYKLEQAIGVCSAVGGLFLVGYAPAFGALLALFGVATFIFATLGAWWNNG